MSSDPVQQNRPHSRTDGGPMHAPPWPPDTCLWCSTPFTLVKGDVVLPQPMGTLDTVRFCVLSPSIHTKPREIEIERMCSVGHLPGFALPSTPFGNDGSAPQTITKALGFVSQRRGMRNSASRWRKTELIVRCLGVSCDGSKAEILEIEGAKNDSKATDSLRSLKKSADWKAARAYRDSGVIYDGRIGGFNSGGLLVRFYSLVGFLPYPQLSPSHSRKEPAKAIQEIAKDMVGSFISVKVIYVNEESRKLIFSEKEAVWTKYANAIKIGDVFEGRVSSLEDYGAFVDLRFSDGLYHLTGLVHISEVSWDLVQDIRDVINEGDEVRAKVIQVDKQKSRINLSIKQLEDDPLLVTLDKVISKEDISSSETSESSENLNKEPLLELEGICQELLKEDGINDVQIGRQGFEKRVVSQDLEIWLSNTPASDGHFTLLARAGRQVQEVHLKTSLDLEAIKKAVQRVTGRVP